MHLRSFVIAFAVVALSAVAFGQPGAIPALVNPGVLIDAYQINYLPTPLVTGVGSSTAGGGFVNVTNAGQLGADAFGPLAGTTGRICVNVYVFTSDEQEVECCSCLVTPNALVHLTYADLTGNTASGGFFGTGIVVKLLATIPGTGTTISPVAGQQISTTPPGTNAGPFTGNSCNAAFAGFDTANLAPGMRAWAVKFHTNGSTSPASTAVTETAFLPAGLSAGELAKLTNLCRFIAGNQSGAGICKACTLGGLGAGRQ